MANPYRSREGLNARPGISSDEVQLRIDPLHSDLDHHISGLYTQVSRLKTVAQEIETESKLQNEILADLQMTMSQTGDKLKNGMRRLNRAVQQRSNHTVHVVVFGLVFFATVYFLSKLVRR